MKRILFALVFLFAFMIGWAQQNTPRKVIYTTLQTTITSVENWLTEQDLSQYPPSAVLELQDALQISKDVVAAQSCTTTAEVSAYRTALNDAKTKLKNVKGQVWDISDIIKVDYDADRGFVHPGGLHTQADFDRIKAQLAEGDSIVTAAYNVLKSAAYAQSSAATYPTETIVRGGSSGENYMNAARGATIAYQNGLRWKIEGNTKCAQHAVDVLMSWARTTTGIGGDSNYALAAGLYGYQFAQAAELVRDYEGWSKEDFHTFQKWMLDVWYPSAMGFLRGRNGTWENSDKWWQAPGHYWSNWGLCNALCIISVGILCDDVAIYNQGMSFIKYDQVGTFKDPRTDNPILNDGLTEFWGNLVVTTYPWDKETGAYGIVGQMNESGRDAGHCGMAVGLAVDVAHQGWNQGDDLFSWMDHRIAAGIEYVAAQSQNQEDLPWVNYKYGTNGIYYTDSRCWEMTGPAMGAQIRPCWGTVIGLYEGVKGVKMPWSEMAYTTMGIDGGGAGSTSGGYDQLGYSVLMNTYGKPDADGNPYLNPTPPTELSGKVTYNGTTVNQSDLGCLNNTYSTTAESQRGVAKGTEITLIPCLPDSVADTGNWKWNTGETTKDITITANESHVYRVTYINENGVESKQCFSIAVLGDSHDTKITQQITYKDVTYNASSMKIMYGSTVTLKMVPKSGYGNYYWDNGQSTQSITITSITSTRDIQGYYENQCGKKTLVTFHLDVTNIRPDIQVNGTTLSDTTTVIVNPGDSIVLTPVVPGSKNYGTWTWDNGSDAATLALDSIQETAIHTVEYAVDSVKYTITYNVFVKEATDRLVDNGNYLIKYRYDDTYLTNGGDSVCFSPETKGLDQIWYIEHTYTNAKYNFYSLADSMLMKNTGSMYTLKTKPHRISFAAGTNYCALYNASNQYWYIDNYGKLILGSLSTLNDYAFELIPWEGDPTGITAPLPPKGEALRNDAIEYYTVGGIRLSHMIKGVNIIKMSDGTVRKVIVK